MDLNACISISNVPNDVLVLIAKYLSDKDKRRCLETHTRFKNVFSNSPSHVCRLDKKKVLLGKEVQDKNVEYLLDIKPNLQTIQIKYDHIEGIDYIYDPFHKVITDKNVVLTFICCDTSLVFNIIKIWKKNNAIMIHIHIELNEDEDDFYTLSLLFKYIQSMNSNVSLGLIINENHLSILENDIKYLDGHLVHLKVTNTSIDDIIIDLTHINADKCNELHVKLEQHAAFTNVIDAWKITKLFDSTNDDGHVIWGTMDNMNKSKMNTLCINRMKHCYLQLIDSNNMLGMLMTCDVLSPHILLLCQKFGNKLTLLINNNDTNIISKMLVKICKKLWDTYPKRQYVQDYMPSYNNQSIDMLYETYITPSIKSLTFPIYMLYQSCKIH
jgi:hypothetical protein